MVKVVRASVVIIGILLLSFSMAASYGGGSGTAEDPYQIWTPEQMNAIGANPDHWDKHFKLLADIDMSGYTGTQYNIIGNHSAPFSGVFDGSQHIIWNFTCVAAEEADYTGLFGCTEGATIQSLRLENVSVSGHYCTGGLVGENDGIITSCQVQGSITGTYSVGGLAGWNNRTITACCASGLVTGNDSVGGLVGSNYSKRASITACHASGQVTGSDAVGGLAGWNGFSLLNSCYAVCRVTGSTLVGGLVGDNQDGMLNACFWDTEVSQRSNGVGIGSSTGSTGKRTHEMKDDAVYSEAGWDFGGERNNGLDDYWQIAANDYPRLAARDWALEGCGTSSAPYLIRTADDMGSIWLRPAANYRLIENVDLDGISWSSPVIVGFAGCLDGSKHAISNFSLDLPQADVIGFSGHINVSGEIKHLVLRNATISGRDSVGGLAGLNDGGLVTGCAVNVFIQGNYNVGGLIGENGGIVTGCQATGSVNGSVDIGGLVGWTYGNIDCCYSSCAVSGRAKIGGLVGYSWDGTTCSSYASGPVIGTEWYIGGFLGSMRDSIVNACFWNAEASGQSNGLGSVPGWNGIIGLTNQEMMTLSTFTGAGWDFSISDGDAADWMMQREGEDYPRLAWQEIFSGDIAGLYGVDLVDFSEIARNWLEACPGDCEQADIDGSGLVDLGDVAAMAEDFLNR